MPYIFNPQLTELATLAIIRVKHTLHTIHDRKHTKNSTLKETVVGVHFIQISAQIRNRALDLKFSNIIKPRASHLLWRLSDRQMLWLQTEYARLNAPVHGPRLAIVGSCNTYHYPLYIMAIA